MDCRASLLVGLGLLAGAVGCTPTSQSVRPPDTQFTETETPVESKPKLKGKRQPTPEACVKFGDFALKESASPGRSEAEQRQMLDQARRAYQQALQINSKYVPAHRGLAQVYLAEGDHDRAVSSYQASLKVFPRQPLLWFDLGMVYARNKEWQPAINALSKACELAPQDRQMAHALGNCLARSGAYDQSLECFFRVDSEARAYYNVGRMLHHMKQDELALRYVRIAVQKEPEMKEARELLTCVEGSPKAAEVVVPAQFEQQPGATAPLQLLPPQPSGGPYR